MKERERERRGKDGASDVFYLFDNILSKACRKNSAIICGIQHISTFFFFFFRKELYLICKVCIAKNLKINLLRLNFVKLFLNQIDHNSFNNSTKKTTRVT